jgi:hypothetical protein
VLVQQDVFEEEEDPHPKISEVEFAAAKMECEGNFVWNFLKVIEEEWPEDLNEVLLIVAQDADFFRIRI